MIVGEQTQYKLIIIAILNYSKEKNSPGYPQAYLGGSAAQIN